MKTSRFAGERGRKTLYVPSAICWHRIGASVISVEARRFSFRGVLTGRLLFATKLLPARYVLRTWLISGAGLAKDLSQLRCVFGMDRIAVLLNLARLAPRLLRERKSLFNDARRSPEQTLDFLMRLTNDDVEDMTVSGASKQIRAVK
jgi:hypothetical protein